jgi:hypothetical protein
MDIEIVVLFEDHRATTTRGHVFVRLPLGEVPVRRAGGAGPV